MAKMLNECSKSTRLRGRVDVFIGRYDKMCYAVMRAASTILSILSF